MRTLVLAVVVVLAGCGGKSSDASVDAKPVALAFANHLVARDFAAANAMLATPITTAELQTSYDTMVEPIGKVKAPKLMESMTDWPEKKAGDAGWVYVAIEGESGSEAVTVVVTGAKKIRSIEWGRP